MRRRGNVDSNHREIVRALEGIGATVTSLADLGEGVPDLLVGFRRRNRLIEIKDGRKAPSRRKARPCQEDFAATWNGEPVCLVRSPEEAIEAATADVVPARLLLDARPALERKARGSLGVLEADRVDLETEGLYVETVRRRVAG